MHLAQAPQACPTSTLTQSVWMLYAARECQHRPFLLRLCPEVHRRRGLAQAVRARKVPHGEALPRVRRACLHAPALLDIAILMTA